MKTLITRPNKLGWIDVGWRVTDRDGVVVEIHWGGCKDEVALRHLITDLEKKGEEFDGPETGSAELWMGDKGWGK